jgi:type IV pilus assembly protein PilB
MSQRLGDLLVKEKIITPEQLEQASKAQKEQNVRLGSALVKLGFLTDEDVTNFLSRQYGVPAINLSYFEIDPAVVKLIPFETAEPCGRIAHHRHGRSDQCFRDGRYQVHDRLQHRAGRRL